ncbi:MAG: DNA mismatch repair protein MutL [Sodalis sp. Fle]|nr:MAG: DNA mismatch repair protein MutL [Sodalis sp. Fle]
MRIQVLPLQLANQIAAGEVVERPVSVVKELVENSLDAGATRIDIEIEHGGAKMIRIRDNGCGIDKEELSLALARHATSKIACIDDLECITKMGFRGEALASISSVSRLTLTSLPCKQSEAWQVYVEGRDMAVMLKPAAHPVGTTVEVLDLFYNRPARRKFMRTEKTEFGHIAELIRRIALACFDITFILEHNGKTVRQYRAVNQQNQYLRRLSSLCGPAFVERALAISWQHGDLAIRGWVADPVGGNLPDMQYSYVNQRMVRDKLINHAIRQAYQKQLTGRQQPVFVLFLDVDPHQVDVNVHPTKHAVRFHQARLVHDFVYQAVIAALQQSVAPRLFDGEPAAAKRTLTNRQASGCNHFLLSATVGHEAAFRDALGVCDHYKKDDIYRQVIQSDSLQISASEQRDICALHPPVKSSCPVIAGCGDSEIKKKVGILASPDGNVVFAVKAQGSLSTPLGTESDVPHSFGRVLTLCPPCYALLESSGRLALLSLPVAERYLTERQLTPAGDTLCAQPLLIPLRMMLNREEVVALKSHQGLLQEMGIVLQARQYQAILSAVPLLLREQNLQNLIPKLLGYLYDRVHVTHRQVAAWLAYRLNRESSAWSHDRAIQLLAEVERFCPQWVKTPPDDLLVILNLEVAIKALNHD